MKICAIICEFNPFHNGHKYFVDQVKKISGCDLTLCIMSGSFTQRGDIAALDKFTRAKHAVLGGADCVIELPAAFSVAPAEIFASGAVKILSSIPEVKAIAFGSESGDKQTFLNGAKIARSESEEFKQILSATLSNGESYIKSYAAAFEAVGGDKTLLEKPNNILGLEYAKAVLSVGSDIEIIPVRRVGADFNDGEIKTSFSSASAIRANLSSTLVKDNVPDFVYRDLSRQPEKTDEYERFLKFTLSRTDVETLKRVYGCGEGLENKLKSLEELPFAEIIAKTNSKRYSSARIKRILCANFLNLYTSDCAEYLDSPLYLRPLAVKKELADEVFSALARSPFPVVTCGRESAALPPVAKRCILSDDFAYTQWRQIFSESGKNGKLILV